MKRLIPVLNSSFRYILVLIIYCFYYLYSTHTIPEVIIPSIATDPFFFEIITDIFDYKGLTLHDFPCYFFTPLYAYFVYMIKILTNDLVLYFKLIIFIQMSIFLISTLYFEKLITLLFGKERAPLGFYLYSLFPPFIFHAILPVKDSLTIACTTFSMYNFIRYLEKRNLSSCVYAGLFMGIAANLRGTILFLIPLFLFGIYKKSRLIFDCLAFFLAVVIFILPFTLRNILVAHDAVVLSSVGGLHLYIGNNPDAKGVYVRVPGVRPSIFGHYYDAKKIAEKETGRPMKDSQINEFWKQKTYSFIRTHPLQALKLFAIKALFFVNNQEISNNYNLGYFKKLFFPFSIFAVPYNFGVLFIGGILGLIYGRFKYKTYVSISFIIIMATSLLIFIASRYRLPATVFLMISFFAFINDLLSRKTQFKFAMIPLVIVMMGLTFFPLFTRDPRFEKNAEVKHQWSVEMVNEYHKLSMREFNQFYKKKKLQIVSTYTSEKLFE